MMEKMSKWSRISALCLAVVMLFSLASPTMAYAASASHHTHSYKTISYALYSSDANAEKWQRTRQCTKCGKVIRPMDTKGHQYKVYSCTFTKANAQRSKKVMTYQCSSCARRKTTTSTHYHSYNDGTCRTCGYRMRL